MDRLYRNAQRLLDQAESMGPAADLTVLELPQGGYYLVPGGGVDLDALRAEHGARTGWQVSRQLSQSGSSVSVRGQSGDRSCLLKRNLSAPVLRGILRDAPAYLLV